MATVTSAVQACWYVYLFHLLDFLNSTLGGHMIKVEGFKWYFDYQLRCQKQNTLVVYHKFILKLKAKHILEEKKQFFQAIIKH